MAGAATGEAAKQTPVPRDPSRATVHHRFYKGRGDSRLQLSWRAILTVSVLRGVLSLTDLYIGLKTCWDFGVAITACTKNFRFRKK